jgi:hypothetical protein
MFIACISMLLFRAWHIPTVKCAKWLIVAVRFRADFIGDTHGVGLTSGKVFKIMWNLFGESARRLPLNPEQMSALIAYVAQAFQ